MILHITNDYSGSTVYMNLIKELDKLGVSQVVYNPIKEKKRIGKNKVDLENIDSKIIYSFILNKTVDRFFYRRKINKIVKDIENKIDITKISFIHAHTWYSDGGVAYELHKKYNIPYIIAVRNSDINVFQKFLVYERKFGKKILKNASKIITISYLYQSRLLNFKSLKKIKDEIISKLLLIPNGVDPFWIENMESKQLKTKALFNLLYIGKFTSGKNVVPLMEAIKFINRDQIRIHLHLIGGDGNHHDKVLKFIDDNLRFFTYHGKIFDLFKLKAKYNQSDIFVMPSKRETFGLVYVEAMLNGLPILYTAKEGIDGLYSENIGEKVYSSNVDEIASKIIQIIKNYETYQLPYEKLSINHNWRLIAQKYKQIYDTILK